MWHDRAVLVVEDDPATRGMLVEALAHELGAYAAGAADGVEALAQAAHLRPSVVVLDVALPRLDGVEVARRLKADAATRAAWLIAVSGLTPAARVRQRALEAGCGDFLARPLDLQELVNLVHRRLGQVDRPGDQQPPGQCPTMLG